MKVLFSGLTWLASRRKQPALHDNDRDPAGERLVLDEKRRSLDALEAAADLLDSKLQNLLVAGGLQITLAAGIKVASVQTRLGQYFWPTMGLTLSFYLGMFILVFLALRGRAFTIPIPRTWEELEERYFGADEKTALQRLIVDYNVAIAKARQATEFKSRVLSVAMFLFLVTLSALLAALWLS